MMFACHFIVAAAATMASLVMAVPLTIAPNPNDYVETNADGSKTPPIHLLGRGEEGGYDATVEVTVAGYTVSNKDGNYMYMEFDPTSGSMVSSGLQAGRDHPRTDKSMTTGKKLDKNEHERETIFSSDSDVTAHLRRLIATIEETNGIPYELSHVNRRKAAVIGNKVNLMIPFKFFDHASRVVPSIADLTVLMNNVGPNAALAPSGSVRDVYLASSYSQLVLDTTVAPWVTIPNTEAFYGGGNSGLGTMSHIMIRDALNALQATGFNFSPFDTDNDGYIDAIGFLHSGYGAEWGGTDGYGTHMANRIWSHKWAVYSLPGGKWTSTSGKSVYTYHISPSVWGTSGSAIGRIGVIAHETGHFFGLPDLYDGSVGSGIGSFCLMANSWGFDGTQWYPPHMSAWSKIQLGWVTPTVITSSGTYTARQGCTYPDVFKIIANFPSGEFLLIENRQKCKFDAKIPGPGLAIFHIDESASYTAEGYPGQTGWPTNAQHYRVALLQADGNYNLEKGNNRGDGTDLFFSGGVNGITTAGISSGLAYPNTKAYKGGNILETGISITEIGASSASMTFVVNIPPVPPTPAPIMPPANQFHLKLLADNYPTETAWSLYQTSPSLLLIAQKAAGAYAANTLYNEVYYLNFGNYQFDMTDSYGDGLSPGNYEIRLGGTLLRSGSVFAFLERTTFTFANSTSKPVTSKPVTKTPVTAKPITSQPVTAKPTTIKPVTAEPTTTKKPTKTPTSHAPTQKPTTHAPTPTKKPITHAPTKKPLLGIADSFGVACGGAVAIAANAIMYGSILTTGAFSTGDSAAVFGDVDCVGAASLGANTIFNGTIISQAAVALGANVKVPGGIFTGDILCPAAVTVGARGKIVGNIYACTEFTLGADGSVTGQVLQGAAGLHVPSSNSTNVLADIDKAYTYLKSQPGAKDLETSIINNALLPGIYFQAGAWAFGAGRTLTFNGTSSDTWIIQLGGAAAIAGNIYNIGALQSNIQWAVTGSLSIGAGCNFCGYIISPAAIGLGSGASLIGGMYSPSGSCSLGDGARLTKI